jgi:hypothetical protein
VIVQEKLDGSNVAVAKVDGVLIPIGPAGYPAISSKYEQHHLFAHWVFAHAEQFEFLNDGERLCGEWLAQAHGTRYVLVHDPFVPFDLMRNGCERAPVRRIPIPSRCGRLHAPAPALDRAAVLDRKGARAARRARPRVERKGKVDFLGKYVQPEKRDGCYLPELSGQGAVWNWRPF